MALKFPQADLPRGLSGGSDVWDSDAGAILGEEYFDPVVISVRVTWAEFKVPAAGTPAGSILKAWNGSAWVPGALKRWDGAAWVPAALKRWNGSAWVTA